MDTFPFIYIRVAPSTWAYLSSLLMLALFFVDASYHIPGKSMSLQTRIVYSIEGPGRCREVVGDDRHNSVLIAPLNSLMLPSYDQATKKVNEKKATTISM